VQTSLVTAEQTEEVTDFTEASSEVELDPEAPYITLTKESDTVARWAIIDLLAYVDDIVDDKDERYVLFQQIIINGGVNTAVVGEYEVIYYVVDSDGNKSNDGRLVIVVE
jgi:hypothetical protein